jgi:hypothetical protein
LEKKFLKLAVVKSKNEWPKSKSRIYEVEFGELKIKTAPLASQTGHIFTPACLVDLQSAGVASACFL